MLEAVIDDGFARNGTVTICPAWIHVSHTATTIYIVDLDVVRGEREEKSLLVGHTSLVSTRIDIAHHTRL